MQFLELKVPPVAVFIVCAAAMWALKRAIPGADFDLAYADALALAVALAGLVTAVGGVVDFRRQRTTVHPGKPEAATVIVSSGLYRYSRNPMYLGLAGLLLAWGLFIGNAAALACIAAFVAYLSRFQIRPEERALLEKFGDDYADYRSRVRRWL